MTDLRTAIPSDDISRYRDHALRLADEARGRLRDLQATNFDVKRKPDGSFVTTADLETETRFRELTQTAFPEHGILGEELPPHRPDADFQWIFDPIDGTEDFVHRMPTFGTIIALHYRGAPLVGVIDMPMLEDRISAAYGLGCFRRDQRVVLDDIEPGRPAGQVRLMLSARANFIARRDDGALFDAVTRAFPNHRIYRSCFIHLCVAAGQADVALDVANPIWDIAAARILVEEAGGAFRTVQDYISRGRRVFTSVFGRPAAVKRVASIFIPPNS